MSCECYQIGGRFIAEDPDCPAHGREAQAREKERPVLARKAAEAILIDLSDRSGLGNELDNVDDETKEEMLNTWAGLILRETSTD